MMNRSYEAAGPGRSRDELRRAIAGGDPDEVAAAWFDLGSLERQEGNTDAARDAFEQAVAAKHPDYSAMALSNLAVLEASAGRDEEARSAFKRTIATGHPEHAPQAMFNLGIFEASHGNAEDARTFYRRAMRTGHPEHARKALFNLANLEARLGRADDACELLLQAMEPPFRGDTAWRAHRRLMEIDPGQIGAAREVYLRAMAGADAETAAQARELLQDLDPGYKLPGTVTIGNRAFGLDDIVGAEWMPARPGGAPRLLGIRTRGSEMHIVAVDPGDPDDRRACSMLRERFGLDDPGDPGRRG